MVHFTESGGDENVAPGSPSAPRSPSLSRGPSAPRVAPVIPLFGRDVDDDEEDAYDDEDAYDACTAIEREIAERNLTKRLRTRQLSAAEARVVVRERSLEPEDVEAVIERFLHLGYLDDAALAEQLVHVGVERKGQGRQVIAQTLTKRGIARDVADAALAALRDDDTERALEFARTKARSMASLDRDTAVRRLAGQLARRGYGSSALAAARQAIDEVSKESGVRFR